MKQYIVSSDSGVDKGLCDAIESILKATGGKLVELGEGGHTVLVEASEEAAARLKKLKGVDGVDENQRRIIKRPCIKPPRFGQ